MDRSEAARNTATSETLGLSSLAGLLGILWIGFSIAGTSGQAERARGATSNFVYESTIEVLPTGVADDYLLALATPREIALPADSKWSVLPERVSMANAAPRDVLVDLSAQIDDTLHRYDHAWVSSGSSPSAQELPGSPAFTVEETLSEAIRTGDLRRLSFDHLIAKTPVGLRAPALEDVAWVGASSADPSRSEPLGPDPELDFGNIATAFPGGRTSALIPEPTAAVLLGVAIALLGLRRQRPKRRVG